MFCLTFGRCIIGVETIKIRMLEKKQIEKAAEDLMRQNLQLELEEKKEEQQLLFLVAKH